MGPDVITRRVSPEGTLNEVVAIGKDRHTARTIGERADMSTRRAVEQIRIATPDDNDVSRRQERGIPGDDAPSRIDEVELREDARWCIRDVQDRGRHDAIFEALDAEKRRAFAEPRR